MSTTTMHFGPEWMRTKHQPLSRSQQPPPSPPPTSAGIGLGLSTYSALVSATPPASSEASDEAHPFRYSKDELLRIYQEGGGRGGLGLEVERWEGVVREDGFEPIALREMSEAEKKLFAGPLNSELRRRPSQSTDFLSPLTTSGSDRPRLQHSTSSSANSPLRERFGALKRRDSGGIGSSDPTMLNLARKPSLSTLQSSALSSPRGESSPRTRVGYANFDGVLNNGDSWASRRRTSEASMKPGNGLNREVADSQHNKPSGILEENEAGGQGARPHSEDDASSFPSSSPRMYNEEPRQYSTAVGKIPADNGVQDSASSAIGTSNANIHRSTDIGPPPGLVDLAAVEWTYKDPTGQIQGPFKADLMQKWYNDGYFSGELPMKRVRYDTHWTTVNELVQRANGQNIFLSPLSVGPISRVNGSPLQSHLSSENTFGEPYQPAPIRTLRTSTLESYLNSGSLPSDSPSSSFGASHFGNPSPDPSFNGREIKPYFGGDPTGRFAALGIQDQVSAFTGGRIPGHEFPNPSHNSQQGPSFGTFLPERDPNFGAYGYNGQHAAHDPWAINSNNIQSHGYMGGRDQIGHTDPHSRSLGQGTGYVNDGIAGFSNHISDPNLINEHYGQYDFTTQAPFRNLQDPQFASSPAEVNNNLSQHNPILDFRGLDDEIVATPSPQSELTNLPVTSTQSPWKTIAEPAASQQTIISAVDPSIPHGTSLASYPAWSRPDQVGAPSQSTETSVISEGIKDKDEISPGNTTSGNKDRHNQQPLVPESAEPSHVSSKRKPHSHDSSNTVAVATELVEKPVQTAIKAQQKTSQSAHQIVPTQPSPAESSTAPIALKAAWAKEEEGKNKKNVVPSISLREIQEAEAKKLELRKTAEREKEKLSRASSTAEAKEDAQPFIASWGLPTSQAGARSSVPLREVSTTPAVAPAAIPVWTTPLKQPAVKKTMKEIQEEEESRKKLASKDVSVPVVAKRGYAETTNKVAALPSTSNATNVWTTVGPSGKTSAPATSPVRPIVQTISSLAISGGSSLSRATASPVQKSIAVSALKTRPVTAKQDVIPEAPSHDFLKWLTDSLKGLNSSVNVEEIVSMLLSFPLDPDSSTVEIISDTIYSNSTTLDGRRFASEFVTKRKSDVRSKGISTNGKTPAKPVSIADVVKATPKTSQPEWGFKVVNKKKKGGRS